jgi:large subunit ribosomal protein L31e
MAELERTYNVPLRKEFLKVSRYRRAAKATKALRQFISKHMKSDNVNIGKYLNQLIWKDGIKSPPHHVEVIAKKDKDGKVMVEIPNPPKEIVKTKVKDKLVKKEEEISIPDSKEEVVKEEKPKAPAKKESKTDSKNE